MRRRRCRRQLRREHLVAQVLLERGRGKGKVAPTEAGQILYAGAKPLLRDAAFVPFGDAAVRSWEESLNASGWEGEEVWVHGDLLPGNLLVVDGRLSAVIDFGGLNVGDPACDLQPAWNVFSGESRIRYRAELEVDDASWLRGRGWAFYQAVSALPYYWDTNPGMIRQASHALAQVLADS